MGTPTETDTTIEALLQERAKFEQWLARLDSAGEKAPQSVRQKVRADYEARLGGVIQELRGHAATISGELERHRGKQAELDRERTTAEEALAEAEVRHVVGEYAEDEWRTIHDQSQSNLGRLRQELGVVGGEISRLAEVQSLIAATPRRPESPPKAEIVEPPPPEPELEIERGTPPPTPSVAPPSPPAPASSRPTPSPKREPAPPPGDELAFLKSVSEEERKPSPRRPSNPGGGSGPSSSRADTSSRSDTSSATAQGSPAGKTATPSGAKTLKCGECGTLNRPTEWYCERCGGELAGL